MAHKDIRKLFSATHPSTGETRRFEAVGFLNEGEPSIYGNEMLQRVPDAIGEEDGKFLDECVNQDWSRGLWPYYLATAWRSPGNPRGVRFFYWLDGGCRWFWGDLDGRWRDRGLVVRRYA